MGKSATGKDTVYKELMKRRPELKTAVTYTTRPIREGETEGTEYFFTDAKMLRRFLEEGKVIELRTYETVHGPWSYFTADDGQFDLKGGNDYLMIGTLESYEKMCRYFGAEAIVPLYLELPDGMRQRHGELSAEITFAEQQIRTSVTALRTRLPHRKNGAGFQKRADMQRPALE